MILLLVSSAWACPSLDEGVERATIALLDGNFDATRAALAEGANSFTCAEASREQLAHYWLVEGAAAFVQGNAAGAKPSLAAARRAAPDVFDPRLGPDVRAAWQAAAVSGTGRLTLDPGHTALVDGVEVASWPTAVPATPHVLQVIGREGNVRFGRLVRVDAGEDALVQSGLLPGPEPEQPAASLPSGDVLAEDPTEKRSPALLIVAGVAAAGAGACAGGALAQGPQLEQAGNIPDLDAAFTRQQAFGYSTYGLAGVAVAAFTLHFVLP